MNLTSLVYSLVVSIAVLLSRVNGTVYMDDHCGGTIQHIGDRMYSQSQKYYRNNMDCTTTLTATYDYQSISIDFDWIDFENAVAGCIDYLEVYDGPDTSANLIKRMCGRYEPADILSNGRSLTLRMVTDGTRTDKGFNLVFTSFHNSKQTDRPCNVTGQYRCNTYRCIDATLKCDGRDNCGDWSDEHDCPGGWLTMWAIIGIVTAALVLLTCGVILILALCGYCSALCCKTKRPRTTDEPTTQTTTDGTGYQMSNVTASTSLTQPPPYPYAAAPPSYSDTADALPQKQDMVE